MTTEARLEIVIDVAKLPGRGQAVSGDTVEVIERPAGGISIVMADGEGTGSQAKSLSMFVAHRAIEELSRGTKDGIAARAVGDALYATREGEGSAALVILSADVPAKTVVISRNSKGPVLVKTPKEILVYEEDVPLLGTKEILKPNIYTVPMSEGTFAVAFTEGVLRAGEASGAAWTTKDIMTAVEGAVGQSTGSVAQAVMDAAIARDGGTPQLDMTVVMLSVCAPLPDGEARTMTVRMPV